jgi:hypothetical protein
MTSIEFVQDYVQLRFHRPMLTLFIWPEVHLEGATFHHGESGYRDRLCERIARKVVAASFRKNDEIRIKFDDGAEFIVPLKASARVGSEAGYFALGESPREPLIDF